MRISMSKRRSRLVAAGVAAGAVGALLAGPQAAFAVNFASQSLSVGPAGSSFTVTSAGLWTAAAPAVLFVPTSTLNTSTCAAYATPTAPTVAGTVNKVDNNTITITVPANIALGTNGVAKQYSVCTYASATASQAVINEGFFSVAPTLTVAPTTGPSGGGSVVTAQAPAGAPIFTSVTSPGVAFNLGPCPLVYNGTNNIVATGITKVSASSVTATTPSGLLGTGLNTPYNTCLYDGIANSANLIGISAGPFTVQLPGLALSPAIGPFAGGNSITANSTANFLLGVTAPGVLFTTAATCPAAYTSTAVTYDGTTTPVTQAVILGVGPRKVANNRLAVTVPAVPLVNNVPTTYQVCVYNGTATSNPASTLVGVAPYTSTIVPTLSSIMPNAGSALGGDTIVVTGTGLPTAPGSINATLGGFPLNVTPVSPTAFTAVTPMHAPENGLPLVITTAAGTKTLQNAFTYLNTIAAMPNTAPNSSAIDLSVKGVGFLSSNFSTTVTDAHIYLVNGVYDPTSAITSGNKVKGQTGECGNVLVISDNELICNLDLRTRLDGAGVVVTPALTGARTLTQTSSANDVTTVSNSFVITSAGSKFLYSDVGLPISGTGIPAGTVITAVPDLGVAVLSKAATASGAILPVIGGPLRSVANVTTNSAVTVTAPAGSFQPGDVGLTVTGSGVPANTTIVSVAANGAGATLSQATSTGVTTTLSLLGAPVPNGTYSLTFVTNGAKDANTTDPNYSQSVVSSGSTFTVAPS